MNRQVNQNKVNAKVNAVIDMPGDIIMENTLIIALVFFLTFAATSVAGIPEPDMIFYGTVEIGGVPVTALDNHTIIARISGTSTTVGLYNMGDNLNAGNYYVLRVKLESLDDGSAQSGNTTSVNQNIQIFIRQPNNEELYVEESPVTITGCGEVQWLPLSANGQINYGTNLDGIGTTNIVDFAMFAAQWLQPVCDGTNNNCEGADFDGINGVDIADLFIFAQNWLD